MHLSVTLIMVSISGDTAECKDSSMVAADCEDNEAVTCPGRC